MITEEQLVELGFADGNNGYRGTGAEIVYVKEGVQLWYETLGTWAVIRKSKPRIEVTDIEELKKLLDEN